MSKFILKLNVLQNISYFKKERNKPFVDPVADFTAFVFQILFLAFIYLAIEGGLSYSELSNMNASGLLNYYFQEGIYFVFTTITTVGYGDKSPSSTGGMLFVTICLFLYGAFRLISVIDGFVAAKTSVREMIKNGRLFENMNNHIIVYCDAESIKVDNFIWIKRFVHEMKTSNRFENNDILFVNFNEEIAPRFNQFMSENYFAQDGVKYVNTNIDEENFFHKISAEQAEHIFILANPDDTHSDSKALDFAIRIEEETYYNKDVTAEVVNDKNRQRMIKLAGVDVVIRPTRAYPSFLVSATIGKEGVREVIEELMMRGKDTLEVFDAKNKEFTYGEFLYKASMSGLGTSVAVIYEDGHVDPNPNGTDVIKDARKVILMIHEMRDKCYDDLQKDIDSVMDEL